MQKDEEIKHFYNLKKKYDKQNKIVKSKILHNKHLDIKSKIYQAQCIGNVEPIEYMIPYPSMRSLIEGQNIKYAEQIIIKDRNITNQT